MSPSPEGRLAVIRPVRIIAVTILFAALAGAALVQAHPAAAKSKPCWRKVIDDWYDNGRLDKVYPAHCYREARKHLPEDVIAYSSFDDQIPSAAQEASRSLAGNRSSTPASRRARAKTRGINEPGPDTKSGDPRSGLFKEAFDKTSPRSADGMPLPLLILAGLALLLIAAGAAGLLARRFRARRLPAP